MAKAILTPAETRAARKDLTNALKLSETGLKPFIAGVKEAQKALDAAKKSADKQVAAAQKELDKATKANAKAADAHVKGAAKINAKLAALASNAEAALV